MAETVIVEISDAGEVTVKTSGFTGVKCQQATRALKAALGQTVSEARTPEFFQGAAASKQRQEFGR